MFMYIKRALPQECAFLSPSFKYNMYIRIQDISDKILQTEMEDRWDVVDDFLIIFEYVIKKKNHLLCLIQLRF